MIRLISYGKSQNRKTFYDYSQLYYSVVYHHDDYKRVGDNIFVDHANKNKEFQSLQYRTLNFPCIYFPLTFYATFN